MVVLAVRGFWYGKFIYGWNCAPSRWRTCNGTLQIGEIPDVLGCMDPNAVNYDVTATVDDGSCCHDGDQCDVALTAVLGENQSDGETEWFQYIATMNGIMTVTSQNSTGDATADTYLSIHDGNCKSLEILTAIDGGPFMNDDCCGYYGPSTIHINVTQGTMYTILWTNNWNPGPFTWYIEEQPTGPQDLVAIPGIQSASLSWEAIAVQESRAYLDNINQPERAQRYLRDQYLEKRVNYIQNKRNMLWIGKS